MVSVIVIENQKRKSNGVRPFLVVANGVSFGSFWYEWVLWLLGTREICSLAMQSDRPKTF